MRAFANAKGLLGKYYRGMADGKRPVAWCSAMGPVEVLRALGFEVYFPENHAAMLGARRAQEPLIAAAVRHGYGPDACTYLLSDIGASLEGRSGLDRFGLEVLPPPAVLACNTNQCREVLEWFAFHARRTGAPLVSIRTPRPLEGGGPSLDGYLMDQWRAAIRALEGAAGRALDAGRLRETVAFAAEASRDWEAFLRLNEGGGFRHDFGDDLVLMAPLVVLRGTPEAAAFYRDLLTEVRALPDRPLRRRIFWEGMPVWGKLRFFQEYFPKWDAGVVASTYCLSWVFDLDPAEPLESLARAYSSLFICRDEAWKEAWLERQVCAFNAGLLLFHEARTCHTNTNTRFRMPERMEERTGVPALVLHGDMVDLRHFSEAETRQRLEAFWETRG
jgi:benzoyl-CoA reductase/2-hydroxyglutaryl-CoA dehydratase subunit BcrC/BadD/HgdB